MPERVETGLVAGAEQVGPRLWLVHFELPQIAPQVHAGQCVLVRCADPEYVVFDPFLPRAFFAFAVDRHAARLSVLVERRGRGSAWLAGRRAGDRVLMHGPVGIALAPDRLTRHLLLLADSVVATAGLALLASEATRRGVSVTLVEHVAGSPTDTGETGEAGANSGLPAHLLRADVEYRRISSDGSLLDELAALLPWADEVVVAAQPSLLDTLAARRRDRLPPFTLHGRVPVRAIPLPLPFAGADAGGRPASGGEALPCGTGVCGACVIPLRDGPHLFCREGPAFPLDALRFAAPDEAELDTDDS